MPPRKSATGSQSNNLSHLFLWANLNCGNFENMCDEHGRPHLIEECAAIQFTRQLEDPHYVDELLSHPTMAMALLEYFANPSPTYRPEFANLGRAAVTSFLARADVMDALLNSQGFADTLFELIDENLGPKEKYAILMAEGVVSIMLFNRKVDELDRMFDDLTPELLESVRQNEKLQKTMIQYLRPAEPHADCL